jgi:aerobic carbon-monoxide dehydrogenase medium subunit
MRAMSFHQPSTLGEAISLLAQNSDARCLAGGQTLVAMMNAQLAEPTTLVSLRRLQELREFAFGADGVVSIGAMVPHSEVAAETRLTGGLGVIREAAQVIAHPAVRNLGTMGGSLCHADPNADYPAAVVAADAEIEIAGPEGRRHVPAAKFFLDYLTTVLEPGELVIAVRVPSPPSGAVGVYEKFARVDGDYATVSVALVLAMNGGRCSHIGLALGACGPTPVRAEEAEAALKGNELADSDLEKACAILVEACDPMDDVRGSSE